ncbi:D-sedoheptulose 7-phosphate isomerase [Alloacidobacterium dinghuense]|uniref:Phosphoheptose isomerase n=1 Tax=Alloacidobacterium dinghuense TaxID=2763107 RepID=A0A7G8BGA1_9BACT|nr:D-sedoheptulose 7-phosphate isomerase [Alloacidobacterium dinghuense]QNI31571.1 D-sedoheptulose 7-phosphate isomerase [Alloacidobacterium dinghuense]
MRASLNFTLSLQFDSVIDEHLAVINGLRSQKLILEQIAAEMTRSLCKGGKVLWCGNGGSAADCQHLAAELVGRFRRSRRALPSIALTTDTSILTAVGNDYGFDEIFRRQVEALCVTGDVVVGISTSGNSTNVCAALQAARKLGVFTVGFTGDGGGAISTIAHATLRIPSKDTARIQEAHILCGHILCDWLELAVCERQILDNEAVTQ